MGPTVCFKVMGIMLELLSLLLFVYDDRLKAGGAYGVDCSSTRTVAAEREGARELCSSGLRLKGITNTSFS